MYQHPVPFQCIKELCKIELYICFKYFIFPKHVPGICRTVCRRALLHVALVAITDTTIMRWYPFVKTNHCNSFNHRLPVDWIRSNDLRMLWRHSKIFFLEENELRGLLTRGPSQWKKMCYQYMDYYYNDKTALRPSYIHNGNSRARCIKCTGEFVLKLTKMIIAL